MRYSAVHMDFARDFFIAWDAMKAGPWPMHGPVLAGTIHLGPVWYWLLIGVLSLCHSWYGTALALGFIASTQFPLAYLVGKELHSRTAGILWSFWLLVPSWNSLGWVLPLHYLLSAPLVIAFLLCATRYVRRPRFRYLLGMSISFVLCLHAHPSNAGIFWIGLAVLLWAGRRGVLSARDVAFAGLIGLIPFLPYFVWDISNHFADVQAGAHYLDAQLHLKNFANTLPVLYATAVGGSYYWFDVLLMWPPSAALALSIVLAALMIIGVLRLGLMARVRERLPFVLAMFAAAIAVALTLSVIRDVTPYYMTTALRVVLVGLVSIGLAEVRSGVGSWTLWGTSVLVAVASFLACALGVARYQTQGNWPFNFFPMFDIKSAERSTTPLFLMPAYGVAKSGRFVCEHSPVTVHGVFAQYILHGYAMDERLSCSRADVTLGGGGVGILPESIFSVCRAQC
jgi:hypothetical protein